MTRACSRGELRECNCDRKSKEINKKDGFKWGGCSENVGYGIQFARTFIDSRETQQDPPALMNLHNNRVGRRVSQLANTIMKCTHFILPTDYEVSTALFIIFPLKRERSVT